MEMYPKLSETQEALPCCGGIEHLRRKHFMSSKDIPRQLGYDIGHLFAR